MYGPMFGLPGAKPLTLWAQNEEQFESINLLTNWQGHFGLISIVIMPWVLLIDQTHHSAYSWVFFFLRTRFISIHRDESEMKISLPQS